jgi:hypothetical protein
VKVYIAGPMTGLPDYNYPAFHAAAKRLREQGHEVENPAESFGGDQSLPWQRYLRSAIIQVCICDAVAVLPGWQQSKGATLETHIARSLGMPVLDAETLEPVNESAAQEAHRLVHGGRQQDYGHPFDDFSRSGQMWGAILSDWATSGERIIPPHLVGLCMVAVKISRELNHRKRDNRVDIAGYAETLQLVAEREGAL